MLGSTSKSITTQLQKMLNGKGKSAITMGFVSGGKAFTVMLVGDVEASKGNMQDVLKQTSFITLNTEREVITLKLDATVTSVQSPFSKAPPRTSNNNNNNNNNYVAQHSNNNNFQSDNYNNRGGNRKRILAPDSDDEGADEQPQFADRNAMAVESRRVQNMKARGAPAPAPAPAPAAAPPRSIDGVDAMRSHFPSHEDVANELHWSAPPTEICKSYPVPMCECGKPCQHFWSKISAKNPIQKELYRCAERACNMVIGFTAWKHKVDTDTVEND